MKLTHKIILEAYEEHHLVKHTLQELDDMSKHTEEWKAKLIVLKENVEHHVKEEEQIMLKKAVKILKSDQKEGLGRKMAEAKKTLLQKMI